MSAPTVLSCLPLPQAGIFPDVHLLEGKKGGTGGGSPCPCLSCPKSNPFSFLPVLFTACWVEGGRLGEMPGPPDNHQVMKRTGPGLGGNAEDAELGL